MIAAGDTCGYFFCRRLMLAFSFVYNTQHFRAVIARPGSTLVIPKEHHTSVATVPENIAGRMFLVGSRLGVAMRRAMNADGFNLHLSDGTVAGQVVMHAHLHVVPRWVDDQFHWNWRQLAYESDEAKTKLRDKIAAYFQLHRDASEMTED